MDGGLGVRPVGRGGETRWEMMDRDGCETEGGDEMWAAHTFAWTHVVRCRAAQTFAWTLKRW